MDLQAPAPVIVIQCDPNWTECQKKQARAKVQALDERCPLPFRGGTSAKDQVLDVSRRDNAIDSQKAWMRAYRQRLAGKPAKNYAWLPDKDKSPQYHPQGDDSDYADPCMKEQLDGTELPRRPAKGDRTEQVGWQPDHIVDLQLGGRATGPLWLMDADVNESLGRQIKNRIKEAEKNGHDGVSSFDSAGC